MKNKFIRVLNVLGIIVCLAAIGYFVVWDFIVDPPKATEIVSKIGLAVLIVGWIAVPIYDAITGKISDYANAHKKKMLVIVTALAVASVFAACYCVELINNSYGRSLFDSVLKNSDIFSYYTAQLSITFISISVLSVLSDKSVVIYWANVSEDRLIKPTFSCFAAYTYYSIGAAVGSGIGVLMDNGFILSVFFALNVLVMIFLTLSMIDVYYGRDEKKKKLRCELMDDYIHVANARNDMKRQRIPEARDLQAFPRYTEKMLGFRQHLYNAYTTSDFPELRELYSLYAEDPEMFNVEEGEHAVRTVVDTFSEKTLSLFVGYVLNKECFEIFKKQKNAYSRLLYGEEVIYEYLWDCDLYLWKSISESRFVQNAFLEKNSMQEELQTQLLNYIRQRVSLLYNYLVIAIKEEQKGFSSDDYFIRQPGKMYINKRAESGVTCKIDIKVVEEVFEMKREFVSDNAEILRCISKVLDTIDFSGLSRRELEEEFPFLSILAKYAE